LPAYKRLSHRAEALIAEIYLAGMNTRRARRALAKLFEGHIGKDVVSRAWQRTRSAWEAWQRRDLAGDDIVRLILDGTVVKVRLDRKATAISLLIALGIRRDGQKVVLAIKNMGGESEAAWRAALDDLTSRGLARPELVIVDGGKGLEAVLASLWDDVPVQRCTVHKERNLLAHAPKHLHDEIKVEFNDMMHAPPQRTCSASARSSWPRGNCAAGRLPTAFLRYPPEQWRSLRTTNPIERLHEEYKRRIKTQCLLSCAETAAMLFWPLLASRSDHHASGRRLADPRSLTHQP
jgi:putative transposase